MKPLDGRWSEAGDEEFATWQWIFRLVIARRGASTTFAANCADRALIEQRRRFPQKTRVQETKTDG